MGTVVLLSFSTHCVSTVGVKETLPSNVYVNKNSRGFLEQKRKKGQMKIKEQILGFSQFDRVQGRLPSNLLNL